MCRLVEGLAISHLIIAYPIHINASYVMLLLLIAPEHVISCAIVDCIHVGSASASFKDLVTLHKRTLQQIFCRGTVMASFGHGNS